MEYVVAVRALCEFTAREGDLDQRFTPSPTAQDGMAGHALVASRRPEHYQTEVSLSGQYRHLKVRGRADGYDPHLHQLEEIKTHRGDLARMPANHRTLHLAQLKLYGWLMCDKLAVSQIKLALVYVDIVSQQETLIVDTYPADELRDFFELQCTRFMAWSAQEAEHRLARDRYLLGLAFPHAQFRDGQRDLAQAVYRSAKAACCVMIQAPTGIGKTVGTLFPLLKAMPEQRIDKVFFLTAKTSGRRLALDAAQVLQRQGAGLGLRVLELSARDKVCVHPDKACHGESCPLARGFYDRLPGARAGAIAAATLDQASLLRVALDHAVCPYYLAQAMIAWSDIVVGDYNYYFDSRAILHGAMLADQWRVGILVDEAHNLVERARKMYSVTLDQQDLGAARHTAPPALKKPLDKLHRSWNALNKTQDADYAVHPALPAKLLTALQQAVSAMGEHFVEQPSSGAGDPLLDFYFGALQFTRLADVFDESSLFDLTHHANHAWVGRARAGSRLCLRNVVPAPFLGPRFRAAHSLALFSATLAPYRFFADVLGLPAQTPWVDVSSPFKAEQLAVHIAGHISTRYDRREASLVPIVDLIANQYSGCPGNYLAFFSSFDYLQRAARLLRERHPHVPVSEQSRRMDEPSQQAFLADFTASSSTVGFAVLGGSFGEGIDLPGQRLVGAFIATLGLPQVNPVNDAMMARLNERFGVGYDYTYLYPGMQKVVQAAGRVIRTQTDQGVVYLIDERYTRRQVRSLLPAWWQLPAANGRSDRPV